MKNQANCQIRWSPTVAGIAKQPRLAQEPRVGELVTTTAPLTAMFSVARFDVNRVRGAKPVAKARDAPKPSQLLDKLNTAATAKAKHRKPSGRNAATKRPRPGSNAESLPASSKRGRRQADGAASEARGVFASDASVSFAKPPDAISSLAKGQSRTHIKFGGTGSATTTVTTGDDASSHGDGVRTRVKRVIDPTTQWRSSRKFKGFVGQLIREVYKPDGAAPPAAVSRASKVDSDASPAGEAKADATVAPASAAADAAAWKLGKPLQRVLESQGVENFFPIQRLVVPELLRGQASNDPSFCDVCIAAPTGSGKTLSYVLPIVQALSQRTLPCLRAVVVVPTRELVQQVAAVFKVYTAGTDLTVETAMGHVPFHQESERLCSRSAMSGVRGGASTSSVLQAGIGGGDVGVNIAVDILVATPGRLVDHLDDTPGFTLEHLQFLVVDEADRLLSQSYQNWVYRVYDSTFQCKDHAANHSGLRTARAQERRARHFSVACGMGSGTLDEDEGEAPVFPLAVHVPLRRIICSATLTNNPQKLAMLALNRPRVFRASDVTGKESKATPDDGTDGTATDKRRYKTPEGLKEAMVVCDGDKKPLVLIQLLQALGTHPSLVFCSSVEKVHR